MCAQMLLTCWSYCHAIYCHLQMYRAADCCASVRCTEADSISKSRSSKQQACSNSQEGSRKFKDGCATVGLVTCVQESWKMVLQMVDADARHFQC